MKPSLFISLAMAATLGACATPPAWLAKGTPELVRPETTNIVSQVETNDDGTLSTNTTAVVTPPVYVTNYAAADSLQASKAVLDTVGTSAGQPWVPIATSGALAGLSIWLGFVNRRNKRKALEQESALGTALDAAGVLVENVEKLRAVAKGIPGYTPDMDEKVMTAIQLAQVASGPQVKQLVEQLVAKRTK